MNNDIDENFNRFMEPNRYKTFDLISFEGNSNIVKNRLIILTWTKILFT